MTHKQKLQQAQSAQNAGAKKAAKGEHRQKYHFMPPSGWLNDPNGCIWFEDRYHIFYQHNPYKAVWGAMHWGHATSTDLVHWRHHPIVLAPSESYDDHEQGGVFSGSTVNDAGNMVALYTGTAHDGEGFVQTQCLARSEDGGMSFEKYKDNPVIGSPPAGTSADFRDPRVLRHKDSWYMILGASLGGGAWHGGEGCAHMYKSQNLISWDYCGIIARSNGKWGTMWECPDLFPLGDKWVLTFSPMFCGDKKAVYWVGDMDFDSAAFTPLQTGSLDFGGEYYAAQSMKDANGRTVLMAWQNGWDWMPGWKDFGPTEKEGWCGCFALPRTATIDGSNHLLLSPVKELELLRDNHEELQDIRVTQQPLVIPVLNPVHFELVLQVDMARTNAQALILDLRANQDYRTRITIDFNKKKLEFDRNQSDNHSSGSYSCDILLEGNNWNLQIFSDTSSIELFCDNGRTSMSNTVYPLHENQTIELQAQGGEVRLKQISCWELAPQAPME